MHRLLAFAALLSAVICVSGTVRAADYQGRVIDNHVFGATVYGPQGAEPAAVMFVRDEARIQMLDGEAMLINLYSRTVDDMHFVTGRTLDGRFYRLDVNETPWLFGRGSDPFFMPWAPNNSAIMPNQPPPMMGGHGHHGGG